MMETATVDMSALPVALKVRNLNFFYGSFQG